jgi:hypothetical protein
VVSFPFSFFLTEPSTGPLRHSPFKIGPIINQQTGRESQSSVYLLSMGTTILTSADRPPFFTSADRLGIKIVVRGHCKWFYRNAGNAL